ncbi:hypothetical protein DCAR_0831215 [Daucus carota subsp. sativus]|uniref:Uncharacterized protein n=1 Tax=Daucus carota subsp. sativus TaxID=79200 RepID=A0A175YLQ1_DAUCS|nr:hypothetical protein DCAR_0831215 [Daucus carota subsp. sativus]
MDHIIPVKDHKRVKLSTNNKYQQIHGYENDFDNTTKVQSKNPPTTMAYERKTKTKDVKTKDVKE